MMMMIMAASPRLPTLQSRLLPLGMPPRLCRLLLLLLWPRLLLGMQEGPMLVPLAPLLLASSCLQGREVRLQWAHLRVTISLLLGMHRRVGAVWFLERPLRVRLLGLLPRTPTLRRPLDAVVAVGEGVGGGVGGRGPRGVPDVMAVMLDGCA